MVTTGMRDGKFYKTKIKKQDYGIIESFELALRF